MRKEQRLVLIVRHVHGRDAQPPLQLAELDAHPLSELRVEVRERLVEEEQLRFADEGPRESEPLLLAPRELRRGPRLEAVETDERERFGDRALLLGAGWLRVGDLEREGDVLEHGHVRPDRVALEHHPDVARVGGHEAAGARQDASVQRDRAALRALETGEAAQRRRLSATGRTEERIEAAVLDGERHVFDRADAAAPARVRLAERGDLEHQLSRTARPPRRCNAATRMTSTNTIITESAAIAV